MSPRPATLAALLALGGGLIAPPALAGGAAGLELGPGATQQGSGQHQIRPQIGGWAAVELGERWAIGVEGHASRRVEGQAPATFDARWARAAACASLAIGDGPAQLQIGLGPAVTWRETSITVADSGALDGALAAARREYGARYRIGLGGDVGGRWRIEALAGGSTRGRSADHDLMIRGGVRW